MVSHIMVIYCKSGNIRNVLLLFFFLLFFANRVHVECINPQNVRINNIQTYIRTPFVANSYHGEGFREIKDHANTKRFTVVRCKIL